MKLPVAILILLLLGSACYWAYRAVDVFVYALGDYAPSSYDASETGRKNLEAALLETETVGWTLADGSKQNAFYLPSRNGAFIIYAHGSPGSGLSSMQEARALARAGYGALLLDLPGYGRSQGERAWDRQFLESIRLAVDFAVSQPGVDPGRIGGFGYSNGGCLIARAAATDPRIAALTLVASYTNLTDQLQESFRRRIPGLGYVAIAASLWSNVPVRELDTVAALRQLGTRPVLILSGGHDNVIPVNMAYQLQSASYQAEMIVFSDMNHIDFAGQLGESYLGPLGSFWDTVLVQSREK